jgi:hypothetical protein
MLIKAEHVLRIEIHSIEIFLSLLDLIHDYRLTCVNWIINYKQNAAYTLLKCRLYRRQKETIGFKIWRIRSRLPVHVFLK